MYPSIAPIMRENRTKRVQDSHSGETLSPKSRNANGNSITIITNKLGKKIIPCKKNNHSKYNRTCSRKGGNAKINIPISVQIANVTIHHFAFLKLLNSLPINTHPQIQDLPKHASNRCCLF